MFSETDKEYLNNPDFNMALEKYFNNNYYQRFDAWPNQTINKAYSFSNEKMQDIFKHLNVRGKKVLTVGSSGDQAINAFYYGAKDITVIDANLFTKYYTEYKIAAIKNLSFENFRQYFVVMECPFAKEVYQKIFQDLDVDCQTFWATIFLNDSNDPFNQNIYDAIADRIDCNTSEIGSSFYNNPVLYKRLQKMLRESSPKISYINAEFSDFPTATQEKYDIILLSNIFKYTEDSFKEVVTKLYQNNLSNGGKIQLHYNYLNYEPNRFPILFPDKKTEEIQLRGKDKTYFMTKPKKQPEREL